MESFFQLWWVKLRISNNKHRFLDFLQCTPQKKGVFIIISIYLIIHPLFVVAILRNILFLTVEIDNQQLTFLES